MNDDTPRASRLDLVAICVAIFSLIALLEITLEVPAEALFCVALAGAVARPFLWRVEMDMSLTPAPLVVLAPARVRPLQRVKRSARVQRCRDERVL